MSNRVINLYEFAGSSSLATRQIAREIFDLVLQELAKNIVLDFSQIEHASLSFFDELNSKKNQLKSVGKNIEFEGLNEDLKNIFGLVTKNFRSSSKITYPSVANVEVVTI